MGGPTLSLVSPMPGVMLSDTRVHAPQVRPYLEGVVEGEEDCADAHRQPRHQAHRLRNTRVCERTAQGLSRTWYEGKEDDDEHTACRETARAPYHTSSGRA